MSQLPTHVQYRNATYFGLFQQYQRNGHGLLILDNSTILLAYWKKNAIHGKYIYISDSLRAYGQMLGNRLDGYNILWTKGDRGEKILYGMFRDDKLYGKAVSVDNGQVMVGQYTNSELKQMISKSMVRDREVYEALTQHFPKNMYTLEQFLISFMKEAALSVEGEEEVPRYIPVCLPVGEDRFIGYEECFNKGRRYGFILQENKVLSVGEHMGNMLEGIGRFYAQQCVEDGIFKQGHLRGIGIKYYPQGNKYTLGEHDGKSALQKGFGFPTRQICEIRKEFHLRSIYFYNDIVMLGLNSHFTTLLNTLVTDSRPKRTESPKFIEQMRTANHPALYKYDVDPQVIDESSPIKDKFSEYRPVDKRSNKYFTLDREEEQYEKKMQKERVGQLTQFQKSRNVVGKIMERQVGSGSRFYDQREQKQDTSSKTVEGRDRSASRNAGRSGVKDTRTFVRELQEEQKRKRLDLDKIYRQAGLYRRK